MMKRLFFVMAACAAICACNSKEDIVKPNINDYFDGDVAYLTVRIKDAGTQTRGTTGGFAYGTEAEQNVSSADFYFYDDNGDYITYGSLGAVSGTANDADSVVSFEWSSNTVVAVWGLTDAANFPTKMVTVLNQPANFVGTHKSLSEMTAALAGAIYNGSGDFVMSTSVYDGTDGVVNYTALKAENFAKEPIDVDGDYGRSGGYTAVDVYVERLAAKVGMTLNSTMGDGGSGTLSSTTINGYTAYDFTDILTEQFMDGVVDESNPVYVAYLGWDIDATARDSYMLKNIDDYSDWSGLTFVWNGASYSRSYWAESPNYGVSAEYPTSSNGNYDADEDTTPLNQYLRYTSLANPIAFGSYGYCEENTNTVEVLGDEGSTAITNAIIKAQAYTGNETDGYTPLDIVEWHGEYYTADDFCETVVADVVDYDFTVLVDEVIAALKAEYPIFSTYLDELSDCVIKDNVWVIPAVPYHLPNGRNVNGNQEPQKFDGSMLSLYNAGDGNVNIFFNGAQPYWGDCESSYDRSTGEITSYEPNFTAVNDGIMDKYPESAIVYGGADLDDYEFMFHIDEDGLGPLEEMGLIGAGVIFQINGDYYMILGNNFSFETDNTGDPNFTGNHTYTLRNYLLRAITVEADGINSEFGSLHPNLFKDGLMYYHTPIEHLGTAPSDAIVEGQYGVVRNHWYNINVTYFSRLGRGIADENEVIVPQPELDYYYLGTDVNIQSWQMINQEVGF